MSKVIHVNISLKDAYKQKCAKRRFLKALPLSQGTVDTDEEPVRELHFGEERAESEQEPAESVVRDGLKKLRSSEQDLASRGKGDSRKVRLAMRLRAETSAGLKWVATRLVAS